MTANTQDATQSIDATISSEAQPQSQPQPEAQPQAEAQEAETVEQPTGLSQYERTVAKGLRDIASIDEKLAALKSEESTLRGNRTGIVNLVRAFEPVLGRKLIDEPESKSGSSKPRTQNTRKLADVIVETFNESDTASLNAELVTTGVKERGFIFGGTDRSTYQRIHGEFRKLVEAGTLRKVSSGHYGLVDPTAPEVVTEAADESQAQPDA